MFLKYMADIIAPVFSNFFNVGLKYGMFPDTLKIARVVPIFKSDDKTKPHNYRPISVLSCQGCIQSYFDTVDRYGRPKYLGCLIKFHL